MKKTLFTTLFLLLLINSKTTNANITSEQLNQNSTTAYTISISEPNKIEPQKLLFELKPGQSAEDYILVKNISIKKLELNIYLSEEGEKNNQGNFSIKQQYETQENIGKWSTSDVEKITLEPNEEKKVKISIQVPQDAEKKTYLGGVAVVNPNAGYDGNIKISTRIIKTIKLTVTDNPKEIPRFGQTNIFQQNPYLLPTLGIFSLCMGYFAWCTLKERKNKKKSLETNAE